MDIIRKGQIPEEVSVTWTCTKCRSEIRAQRSEGEEHHDQRDGNFVTFVCPVCQHENAISTDRFRIQTNTGIQRR